MNYIFGTYGDDLLEGTFNDDVIFGGEGANRIKAKGGDNLIYGGSDQDTITTGSGNDTIYGEAEFTYSVSGNTITFTYTKVTDSYEDYNEISVGDVLTLGINKTDNKLILDYDNVTYTYEKIAGITDEICGSWKHTNGDYQDVITFNTDLGGIESFTTAQDTGSGIFISQIKGGNHLYMTHSIFLGDFKEYNNVSGDLHTVVSNISVEDSQLTFIHRGKSYIYTKISNDSIVKLSDVKGTWKCTAGTYTDFIRFYNVDDLFSHYDNYGLETFIDESRTGMATFFWTVNADMLILDYSGGGYMCGDFESYNGISRNQCLLVKTSLSERELTFQYQDETYVYTRLDDDDVIEKSDLAGTWAIQIDDYTDTLELTYSDATFFHTDGLEKFSTNTQSGTADFSWFINGPVFSSWYTTLTGDYEAYNGIATDDFISNYITVSGNQLTFVHEGENYVYTKVE